MFGQNKADDSSQTQDQPTQDQSWQHPGEPIDSQASTSHLDAVSPQAPEPTASTDEPAASAPVPDIVQPSDTSTPSASASDDLVDVSSHDLIEIKQNALSQLHPLMEHLEQNPEEKFKTIMMMIQASDDQTQIKAAYEAAKEIKDDKVRAQALLDIVNEINYFTNQHNS